MRVNTQPSREDRSLWSMDSLLFSFVCQCRGVKFYDLRSAGARWGTKLSLVREPTNPRDPLCVAAWVPGSPGESGSISAATSRPKILGHVAKEVARWLSPLLDSPLRVTRYVATMKIHAGCLFVYH